MIGSAAPQCWPKSLRMSRKRCNTASTDFKGNSMTRHENIKVDVDAGVATITLSRPARLNALVPEMMEELNDILDHLEMARCIVLTGEGRAFCSGADLAVRAASAGPGMSAGDACYQRLTSIYNPMFQRLSRLPIPIVVAVNGAAVGIGCSLALIGDFVIMGESAFLLEAFVNVGLAADGGASWMLPRLVGKARATEMLLLGERIGPQKAVDWGLIYKHVSDDALMAEAKALATRLASGPSYAIGLIRQGIAAALESDFADALAIEADYQRRATDSIDAKEATEAFLGKRTPVFVGR